MATLIHMEYLGATLQQVLGQP